MDTIFTTNYYTQGIWIILGGIVTLYIALNILWNRKLVPSRRQKGTATPYFGNMFKRITQFAFKEDPRNIAPKKAPKIVKKLLTLKTINWSLLALTFALIGLGNINAWIPAVLLIIVVAVQSSGPLKQRDRILNRMFAVASSSFRYGRGAELNPWGYVQIKKWEDLTIPGETRVTFPANWDASSIGARDGFEAHFNTTVTEKNSWIYEWKTVDGYVVAHPINHLPERASYPGSEKHPWHVIPLGVGTQGEVTVDLTATPHMLICGTTGSGKSLSLNTPVLTTKGWKTIGTIEEGDKLYTTYGKTTTVTHLHPIVTPQKAYKITFKSGETIIADGEHLWETITKKTAYEQLTNTRAEEPKNALVTNKTVTTVLSEYYSTDDQATISIPELKELLQINTSSALYRVAKQVGVAELVSKTAYINYKQEPVLQKQKFTAVDKEEFVKLYNQRNSTPTKKYPLTSFMYEKLKEYSTQVRDSDTISVEDLLSYTNCNTHILSTNWIKNNLDFSKPASLMLKEAEQKAQKVASPYPTKIFSLDTEDSTVTYENLLMLAPHANPKQTKQFFYHLTQKAASRHIITKETSRFFSKDTKKVTTAPIEHFPKKLILRAILERSGYYPEQTKLNPNSSILTTDEIRNTLQSQNYLYKGDTLTSSNHYMNPTQPLQGEENILLPVAPYTLGAYLGDGYSSSGVICGEDFQVFENIQKEGYEITHTYERKGYTNVFLEVTFKDLLQQLRSLGIAHANRETNKFHGEVKTIPDIYLNSTLENRKQLLRGLLDTDGTVRTDGRIVFSNTNKQIIDNTLALVASLGYVPHLEVSKRNKKAPTHYKDCYHVVFSANPKDKLFGLDRKNITHQERYEDNTVNHFLGLHKIISIEETTPEPMRCISVDSENRLFLVGLNLIPTHNSVLQRNLIFHCIQHNDMFRFLGVDVKRVELKPFARYSETVLGIGTNLEDGVEIVRYAKEVMETRYQEMEDRGVNHFKDMIDENGKPPYAIMLMVDEAYMFMATEGAKTDEGKMRDQLHGDAGVMLGEIARLGRAAGIHLVLATQRPDATVIRGELKANLDIRIAAGRLDATPSSMVLDSGAATQLPGHIKGRGIVRFGGHQEQFQGYFAEQNWIEEWLAEHPGVEPSIYPAGNAKPDRSADEELEELAAQYDFNDEAIEINGEMVKDTQTEEEFEEQIEQLESPLNVLENTPSSPDEPQVAAPPAPESSKETSPEEDPETLEYLKRFNLIPKEEPIDFAAEAMKIFDAAIAKEEEENASEQATSPSESAPTAPPPVLPTLPKLPTFPPKPDQAKTETSPVLQPPKPVGLNTPKGIPNLPKLPGLPPLPDKNNL